MFYSSQYGYKNIGPNELGEKMKSGDDFLLLDVRTPAENAAQAIEGSYLIPINELPHRIAELPREKELVVYCRVGNRSAYASAYLARIGYKVKNLEGGIMLWNMAGYTATARA